MIIPWIIGRVCGHYFDRPRQHLRRSGPVRVRAAARAPRPVQSQERSLDALGNWASETTGGTAVSRVNNSKNEIGSQGGNTMLYNSVGNLTEDDFE